MNEDRRWNPHLYPQCVEIHDVNKIRKTEAHIFKEMVSMSHVLGTISTIVTNYIKSAFPDNYIATTWNTMEELFSQRGHKFKEILSKPRPIMTLDPKFDPSDDSNFVPQREFDSYVTNDPTSNIWISARNSDPLIKGPGFTLSHKLRRMKMDFNVNFIFDSDIQRIQAQEYIRMNIRHMVPITMHRYIENNIPDNFIDAIANIVNMDKNSEEFLKFLNNYSRSPITRRLRTGSQTMEFFSMQYTHLEMKFNDLPTSNGPVRRGNINISSSFSESITVEFVMDTQYFLQTPSDIVIKPLPAKECMSPVSDTATFDIKFVEYLPYIPNEENGCMKIATITVQADKNGDDSINLGYLLNGEIRNMIKHLKETGVYEDDLFHISVIETPDSRLGGERISFNHDTMDLHIKNMDVYKSYFISLYINKQKINKIEMLNFETDKFGRI